MSDKLASIEQAIAAIGRGEMIVLVDDENRENEGDLVIAAEHVTAENINFMTQHARGLICLSLMPEDFTRLNIPMMVENNKTPHNTAFGISFEAAKGVTTGISAHDRALSVKVAIDENNGPESIIMPGHMFPLKAKPNGVLERAGHTEGSVDFSRLAGCKAAAVICEVMNSDGSMARLPDLITFAEQYQLCVVSIKDLIAYRMQHEPSVEELSSARLPLVDGSTFTIKIFRNKQDGAEHVAMVAEGFDPKKTTKVRLHSECLTGDVFGSSRCDCGWQLDQSLALLEKEGGVLLYLRQEGRGIGLANKIKAYALQDDGMDTVEANEHLGFLPDSRDYAIAAQMLQALQVREIALLTNNPRKVDSLQNCGINIIERLPLEIKPNKNNLHYLKTKRKKLGHLLEL
jgi:3,4-dihydroxy 2-butanone 4-phosphate synthase/GTP cyclohydrolase II